jgi:hypothetical protein
VNTRTLAAAAGIAATIDAATAMLANAHHALGRMSACQSAPEFSKATADFLAVARDVSGRIMRIATACGDDTRIDEFATWLADATKKLTEHPLDSIATKRVLAIRRQPPEGMALGSTRQARGSAPPYAEDRNITIGKLGGWVLADSITSARPDDFYFQHLEERTAIALCADYLDTISALLAAATRELKRRALC